MQSLRDLDLGLERTGDLAALALHIADDAAQPGAQLPDLALHAPVLLGVCVAAGLVFCGFADARVALAQFDDVGVLRRFDELLSARLLSSRLSVGCAMALGCTVVSSTTVSKLCRA